MGVNLKDAESVWFPGPLNPVENGASKEVVDPSEGSWIDAGIGAIADFVDTIGLILGGAMEAGGALFAEVVNGAIGLVTAVTNLIGNAIRRLFGGGGEPPEPLPDLYSPIEADVEEALRPMFTKVDEALQGSSAAGTLAQGAVDDLALLTSESPDSQLWQMQTKIDTLQNERDDFQDIAIEANRKATEALQQYVARGMFLPDSSKVTSVTNPHWSVTFANGKRKLTAKPGWVGEWLYQSAVHRSGDFGPVIEGGTVSPTGREFILDTDTSSASLMYWIRPGTAHIFPPDGSPTPGGFSPPRDIWHTLPEFTFTANIATEHSVFIRVGWDRTTRSDSYGVRVLLNGAEIRRLHQVGIGPWFPGQGGYRTQSIQIDSLNLAVDDVLTFQIWAGATGADQRRLRDSKLQIGWVEPPGGSDVVS